MEISTYTNYNLREIPQNQYNRITFSSKYDEFVKEDSSVNEDEESLSQLFNGVCSDALNTLKVRFWLGIPNITKRSLKAFWRDPEAYLYEFRRPFAGNIISNETLAEIDIKKRKEKGYDKVSLCKVKFDDSTAVYMIKKDKDKLGFIDVDVHDKGILYVNYACTIVGQEDYRNLLMVLMQAAVEDYIIENTMLPMIKAEPIEIGSFDMKRSSIYQYYGAKQKFEKDEDGEIEYSIVTPATIYNKLKQIYDSPKKDFLLPDTEEIFKRFFVYNG